MGLAIRLCHGVAISWDGQWTRHASAVPVFAEGQEEQSVLSFFVGLQSGVGVVLREQSEFWQAAAPCSALASLPLGVGDDVWVRWAGRAGGTEWRRRSGTVVGMDGEGLSVEFGELEQPWHVPWSAVDGRVVRAGAIARAVEPSGADLVGRRIRVYWAGERKCFDGVVTEWDGEVHTVQYDDGMVCGDTLPSEDAPFYRAL